MSWLGWVAACSLAGGPMACGGGPLLDPANGESLELIYVGLDQFSAPTPIPGSESSPLRAVTLNVLLVFTAAEGPATLVVVFRGVSGAETENRIDLETTAPVIAANTGGQAVFRARFIIPETGVLAFETVLVDRTAAQTLPVSGRFTISDSTEITVQNQVRERNSDQHSALVEP